YLAVHRAVIREKPGMADFRSPSQIVQRMTESEHGLRTLHAAVTTGRAGQPPLKVDAEGTPERNENRRVMPANDAWFRDTFKPAGAEPPAPVVQGNVDTPESVFERRRVHVAQIAESLDNAVSSAASVIGQSLPLVRERGWPQQH